MGDQQMLDGFGSDSDVVKKRRGRPPKKESKNPKEEIKKRKYTKKVKDEVTEPKKRGRKPKVKSEDPIVKRKYTKKVKNETVEVKVLKKRGRKPKVALENLKPHDSEGEYGSIGKPRIIVSKKRGRKPKVKDEIKEPKVLKKRGRKPKALEISQIVAVADEASNVQVKVHKKRGRPAKIKDENEPKILKKRGRPSKTSNPSSVTEKDKVMRRLMKKESETRDLFGALKYKIEEESQSQDDKDKQIREFICKEVRQMYGWLACHRLICGIGRECEERRTNCDLLMDNVDRYVANFEYEELGDASRIIRKKKKE